MISVKVTIRTRAEGLLARFAHDLELTATGTGTAGVEGSRWTGEARVEAASIRVVGAIKRGKVDPGVLSAGDRAEIEQKIRDTVFAGVPAIVASARGEGERGEVTVRVFRTATVPARVSVRPDGSSTGSCVVSLAALGIAEVKGPLGAFKLKDAVEVGWETVAL